MGSSNSKEALQQPSGQRFPDNKLLLDRLRALELESRERANDAVSRAEKGYIFVEQDDGKSLQHTKALNPGSAAANTQINAAPPSYNTTTRREVKDISIATASAWEKSLLSDPKNRLALSALSSNPAQSIISQTNPLLHDTQTFNTKIPLEGSPVTNQRSSGRCWLFASTNVFRVALMKKYSLSEFQLSQAYLFFWDKLEKANYFLENVLDTLEEPLDGRLLQTLMASPVGDGGQWDMVANLVTKYGVVPQQLYPDSYHAQNSSTMSSLLTTKLREDALRLRSLAKESKITPLALSSAKHAFLHEIHTILVLLLGPPPSPDKPFEWDYYTSSGAYRSLRTTPRAFSADLSSPSSIRTLGGTDVHSLFSLVHDPRNAYYSHLTVNRLGNVAGGRPITYVNVPIDVLKTSAVAMLRKGWPVFFGCDVGKFSNSQKGIMDTRMYDYELGFNVQLGMSKAERLRTGSGKGKREETVRWRVENSWSDSAGDKGYFVMADEWMDEFVYQVVVDPAVVGKEVKDVLEMQPKRLELWDPMGALA
ncbi:MAG: hypothetical protein M1828_007620 [Chrysothrix sp. TS-e1954]|nr:MAG: hypothetical protein M1828_007620 [Chrysothrix sp. TS-e1954]